MSGRDGFAVPTGDALAPAHARIDALLDEIAKDPPGVYSSGIDITGFVAGKALEDGNETERAETAAAALTRYVARKRGYTGGTYSPEHYSVHDYSTVVSRIAQALLRKKMKFSEATLGRLLEDIADYAADNARTFPIKGLLAQVEHNSNDGLPSAFRTPLEVMTQRIGKDIAGYRGTAAPAILKQSVDRVKKLLGSSRAT